ncbi:hypothetical protein ABZ897_43265 [Nonomuraea sp. NPDC046802]|uniref:hypothetical protein n=1 Tax=Nonomuraea sp. NPDC046802 TaxID=3154919 RepID=UPI0033CA812B
MLTAGQVIADERGRAIELLRIVANPPAPSSPRSSFLLEVRELRGWRSRMPTPHGSERVQQMRGLVATLAFWISEPDDEQTRQARFERYRHVSSHPQHLVELLATVEVDLIAAGHRTDGLHAHDVANLAPALMASDGWVLRSQVLLELIAELDRPDGCITLPVSAPTDDDDFGPPVGDGAA